VIDKTSRYAKVETRTATDARGEAVEALELRAIPRAGGLYLHTPADGERLDHLAHLYLRDARKSWRICDASDVMDPTELLVPGRPVRIPPER
jgi:hypothetical protein